MARPDRSDRRPPWWAHPVWGLCTFALPAFVIALTVPHTTFVESWGVGKHLGATHLVAACGALLAFAAGAVWLGLVLGPRPAAGAEVATGRVVAAYRTLAFVAVLGYLAWAVIGLSRGVRMADLQAVLEGRPSASYQLKQLMAPVAGVTTLTQVASVAGGLGGMLAARGQLALVRRSALVLLVLAGARALFLSERLAILEIVVPGLVAFLLSSSVRDRSKLTAVVRSWFPVLYVAGAATVFVAFEFNRSWSYYRLNSANGYVDFAADRFVGYYATSANNGALLYDGSIGMRPRLFTLQWLADFPVVGALTGLDRDRLPLNELLVGVANPEFNTEGALLAPAVDVGFVGSLFVWFVLGAACLAVFRRVRASEVAWLPLYASLFVGILESGRYFYWGLGRAVVPLVAGLVVARHLEDRPDPRARALKVGTRALVVARSR